MLETAWSARPRPARCRSATLRPNTGPPRSCSSPQGDSVARLAGRRIRPRRNRTLCRRCRRSVVRLHDCTPIVATTGDGPVAGPPVAARRRGSRGRRVAPRARPWRPWWAWSGCWAGRPRGDVVWVPLGVRPGLRARARGAAAGSPAAPGRPSRSTTASPTRGRATPGRCGAACRLADRGDRPHACARGVGGRAGARPAPPAVPAAAARPRPARRAAGGASRHGCVVSLLGYQYRYKGPDLLLRPSPGFAAPTCGSSWPAGRRPTSIWPALVDELGLAERVTLRLGLPGRGRPGRSARPDRRHRVALPRHRQHRHRRGRPRARTAGGRERPRPRCGSCSVTPPCMSPPGDVDGRSPCALEDAAADPPRASPGGRSRPFTGRGRR